MGLITNLLLSGVSGIGIILSSILVVNLCSPFMLSVNGNIKNSIAAFAGFLFFDDQAPTFNVLTGIFIGMAGSTIHAYDEITAKMRSMKSTIQADFSKSSLKKN